MAPGQWYHEDVQFDHAAAAEAIRSLERLERYLRGLAEVRAGAAPKVPAEWSGRFADDFVRELATTQRGLSEVADNIRRTIGLIADGTAAAESEQTRRENLRAAEAAADRAAEAAGRGGR